jgi:DNA polymerase I-like protein with 3'-5' exonuclease and polymerase domains
MTPDWNDDDFVSFDLETSGKLPEYALQAWRVTKGDAWITSVAWVYRENGKMKSGGVIMPDTLYIAAFLQWCIDEGKTLVGWNIQFDVQWLIALGLKHLVDQLRFLDGMLIWRHLEIEPEYETTRVSKKSYSLKTAVTEHLPQYAGYQVDVDFHDSSPMVRQKLHYYNIQDCIFTLRLTRKFYLMLTPKQRVPVWIEAQCIGLVADANFVGMPIDTLHCKALSAKLKGVAAQKLASLGPHGVTEEIVRSPNKLGKLLYDQWLLPVLKLNRSKLTGKTTRSTDKAVLHELAFLDPRAKELREYREALNLDTKFAEAPVEAVDYCDDDGKAHPQARIFGTYSGRLTYASKQGRNKDEKPVGWAIHQSKRGAMYRGILVAPPGYTIVELDAAGQEFRWMAIASNDLTMQTLCMPGEDPHSYMGAKIIRADYKALMAAVEANDKKAKEARQLGKVGNLSLQYRTSAKKLRVVARVDYGIPMQESEAYDIHRIYQETYHRVPDYWDRQIALVSRLGYAETFAGRRVQVRGDWNGKNGWSMGSTAINYRIQGTGADQKYLALMMIRDYIVSIGAKFFFDLHDGIYLLVPDRYAKTAAAHIQSELNALPYGSCWNFIPPVPLTWDAKMGKTWGDLAPFVP